jgi:hypothetical protein
MPNPSPAPNPQRPPSLDGESLWPTHKLSLKELKTFVKSVLVEMVENRDVKWDEQGKPIARLKGSGETSNASWCHLEVDMSAIGMPMDSPLIICSYEGDNFLTWNLGSVTLACTPKEKTPKEVADTLNMDTLLVAFHRFVIAESQ